MDLVFFICGCDGMRISELMKKLQFYLDNYGDLEIYKIAGYKYQDIDEVLFIGGQRCVLLNKQKDSENYKTICAMNKYFNNKRKKDWEEDCNGEKSRE